MIEEILKVLALFYAEERNVEPANNPLRLPTPPPSAQKQGSHPPASQTRTAASSTCGPPNSRIARLIRNFDKAGVERKLEVNMQDPNFTINFSDYLLHVEKNLDS
jgi:hypothetical protein